MTHITPLWQLYPAAVVNLDLNIKIASTLTLRIYDKKTALLKFCYELRAIEKKEQASPTACNALQSSLDIERTGSRCLTVSLRLVLQYLTCYPILCCCVIALTIRRDCLDAMLRVKHR